MCELSYWQFGVLCNFELCVILSSVCYRKPVVVKRILLVFNSTVNMLFLVGFTWTCLLKHKYQNTPIFCLMLLQAVTDISGVILRTSTLSSK